MYTSPTLRKDPQNQYVWRMLKRARRRAKEKGLPFNLRRSDIHIPERCPVLGIKLRPNTQSQNSPSLGRIVPERGYVAGNVLVVSKLANQIKSSANFKQLKRVAEFYASLDFLA